ncbi:sporulation protein [Metabacillus malikii]|uniref:Sporulation-control protein n=1 Tax=Metabacillus malikii TaxID=1504265 RepID=A0ABT9ZCL9_9BACI|nr:sporulation protein [Metabacillus malikii]MDQ0229323.1 sporulation-control protein [Metabacillus malikii]
MSFFKKVITSIGIGSARVDTKLFSQTVTQGGQAEGIVEIRGGEVDQEIAAIKLNLMTLYGHEDSEHLTNTLVYSYKVNDPFLIKKGELMEIPFTFKVPLYTPMTMRDNRTGRNVPPVWIETELDIRNAVDPKDQDHISVEPSKVYETILDAIKIVGFRFRQMENQAPPRFVKTRLPYVQQFEFLPTHGKYKRKLDELEVYILQDDEETTIYFEIDKKTRGAVGSLLEKLNLDEHHRKLSFYNHEILSNRSYISDKIEEMIDELV